MPSDAPYPDDDTVDENLANMLLRGDDTAPNEAGSFPVFAAVPNPAEFFVEGRVFKIIWAQPSGNNAASDAPNAFSRPFAAHFHAKIQRFVVVKPKQKRRYSNCVQISTNGGRGATKSGLRHRDHAIAYTSAIPPPPLPNEMLSKDAIRILPVNQTEKLDDTSRINLVKVYPVEHNVKLCEVGMVAPEDIRKLRTYYKNGLRNELSGRDG